ncbi:family 20 glycosylhydrolase [Staphylococcus hominis]|uniref:family 20 glycosylhydrolase n=1 Tax=Staphylococcus hominis TaxID=1290 RepID=UPI0034D53644
MKKRLYCIFLVIIISIFFLPKELNKAEIEKGVTLDIARKHYSANSIKEIIKKISDYNGDYLQLHFSDNENYSIYSKVLKQESDKSNRYYLTKKELKSIVQYANDKDVQVIPELDLPSHSKAILTLLRKHDFKRYEKVASSYDESTIDFYDNRHAVKFSKEMIKEVSSIFYQNKYKNNQKISLGGDEVPGSGSNQKSFIKYINTISNYANSQNYETKIWNDSITKNGLKKLNHNITIMYWKQKYNKDPNPKDFFKLNHNVENFNSNTLYIFPRNQSNEEMIQSQKLIKQTRINDFNTKQSNQKSNYNTRLNGKFLSFWGEFSLELSQKKLLEYIFIFIKTFFKS